MKTELLNRLEKIIPSIMKAIIRHNGIANVASYYTHDFGQFYSNELYDTEIGDILNSVADDEYYEYYDFVDSKINELFELSEVYENFEKEQAKLVYIGQVKDVAEFALKKAKQAKSDLGDTDFSECVENDNSHLLAEYGIDKDDLDTFNPFLNKMEIENTIKLLEPLFLDACFYLDNRKNNTVYGIDFSSI